MKTLTAFVQNVDELSRIVQAAVQRDNLSMNEISKMTGLTVPTIMRINYGKVERVQAKTVRTLLSGLGYDYSLSPYGELRVKARPQPKQGGLTVAQKERIMKSVMRVLRDELDRL